MVFLVQSYVEIVWKFRAEMAVRIITYAMVCIPLRYLSFGRNYTWRTEDVALTFKYKAPMPIQTRSFPSYQCERRRVFSAVERAVVEGGVVWCGRGGVTVQ
jgi:hypothetical protein